MPTSKGKSKAKTAKSTATAKKKAPRKKESRVAQRIPIQLLVDYQCNGNYLFDFCRDLGTGGVFIETKSPLSTGSKVNLTFTLPDSKETLEAVGKVIWVQSDVPGKSLTPGMGVQFESFNAKQRELLESFIDQYHGSGLKSPKSAS